MVTQAMCTSFKVELLQGIHDITDGGDTIKIALFDENADLNELTTAYSTSNEVSGTGYSAGGATLTVVNPVSTGTAAIVDFADAEWASSTISARSALIYNSSKANRAIAVLDFGSVRSSSNSTFTVKFPTADVNNAILRIL